jgi:AcrR family transcriptional regulator
MAKAQTPRNAWIEAALQAVAAGGPEAIRIEALARALGVTKGGFYWHFDDRPALLEEVLDKWEQVSVDEVIERVEAGGGGAGDKLRRLSELAGSAEKAFGFDPLKADLAIRDWARRDRSVAGRLRRVDNRRMDYMRSLFTASGIEEDEVEARCMLAFSLWIGSNFILAEHRGRSRTRVLRLAIDHLLAGSG